MFITYYAVYLIDKAWNKLIGDHEQHPDMRNILIGITRVVVNLTCFFKAPGA